ncbi:hypothetical protein GH714_007915 [Hevea brasiliensis]|uniref:Uncharacterized protein n=1 Tax=Hevea brasiliensis TaxID=3981 RepID=A0A6A6MBS1_HEVBR|nr:hypothetical protein GH714_007915 [Hevea brasiliensis]
MGNKAREKQAETEDEAKEGLDIAKQKAGETLESAKKKSQELKDNVGASQILAPLMVSVDSSVGLGMEAELA